MVKFTTIIAAAKPKQRSDQYVILAALYDLGADLAPVSSTAINELLLLHLGSKRPPNVSASLRKYTGLVEPSNENGSLKWMLTDAGIAKLASASGLNLTRAATAASFGIDVGIVCALEHPEFSAVVAAFGGESKWHVVDMPRYSHLYRQTSLKIDDGTEISIVGTTATSMGLTAAAIATANLVHAFHPRLVLMIGIAAGTRGGNKQFGDILVADPSVDYNSGKVVGEHGVREFLPDPYPIGLDPRVRSRLKKYAKPNQILQALASKWAGQKPAATVGLHIGPLGAADQVIDDESRVLEIQKNWRKLIGVEMETYGVFRACQEAPEPKPTHLSLKSVCDFASAKGDSWQEYAAYTAASFAVNFLRREWATMWPS